MLWMICKIAQVSYPWYILQGLNQFMRFWHDGSFRHPKQMSKPIDKKITTIVI